MSCLTSTSTSTQAFQQSVQGELVGGFFFSETDSDDHVDVNKSNNNDDDVEDN